MQRKTKLILVTFLGFQILLTSVLKYFPAFVEQFYSNGLFVFITKVMRYTFGWLPFSVGDVFYIMAIFYLIRWLIINRKRIFKDPLNWLLDIGATLSLVFFAFHILWGYNYYREPLHNILKIDKTYTTEELILMTEQLIEKSNTIHNQLSAHDSIPVNLPYSKSEVFEKVPVGYKALSEIFPHLEYSPTSLKKSLISVPLSYMGFSGYINPFTIEAQVNSEILVYKFPTTSCHEVAHQLGYAAENEANFFGFLASIKNPDVYFQYSGYTFGLRYCLVELGRRDPKTYKRLVKTINVGIIKNYQEVLQFWMSYKNSFEPVFEVTYNSFLKFNNQKDGTKSYSYVVALLVNYYKQNSL